jgi:hypothetical protein
MLKSLLLSDANNSARLLDYPHSMRLIGPYQLAIVLIVAANIGLKSWQVVNYLLLTQSMILVSTQYRHRLAPDGQIVHH